MVSAVLLTHRLFLLPALGPLIYNLFIILGGVLFARQAGIASLAYGAVAGALVGIFLISAVGAARMGIGYRISFDVRNPAFLEWVRLSVPLMVGVSLVSADDWILRHFASGSTGAISRLNYAKRLFLVPIAVLGQAAGQASFPFFARLYGEKRFKEFAGTVNDSVSRLASLSLLASGFMISTALPLIDLGLPPRTLHLRRFANHGALLLLVLAIAGVVGGAVALCAGLLRFGQYFDSHAGDDGDFRRVVAHVCRTAPGARYDRSGDCLRYRDHY